MRHQDRQFYSQAANYFEDPAWISAQAGTVKEYLEAVMPELTALATRPQFRVLELGAGMCLASAFVRQRFPGARITCADISLTRMQELLPRTADLIGVSSDGVELVECDFSYPMPFTDALFDVVIFEGALHHSRNLWTTLEECRRILDPQGAVAALREQYLAPLTFGYAIDRLLKTPEVKAGVAENAYLRKQYEYYFRAMGFKPRFCPVAHGKWRWLAPLNGLLFSKWSIWANKEPSCR